MTRKNKMQTAAAMGMLKLYNVNTRKHYIRETNYSIIAKDKDDAQQKWNEYMDERFREPTKPLTADMCYHWKEYRDYDSDYDWEERIDGDTVKEEKYDNKNDLHQQIKDALYPDNPKRKVVVRDMDDSGSDMASVSHIDRLVLKDQLEK